MKKISILGSTGSIGQQTLEIVSESNGELQVVGLTAGQNLSLLKEQIKKFKPRAVAVQSEVNAEKLSTEFPEMSVFCGSAGLQKIATLPEAEIVLIAIVGLAALPPTISAIENHKDIAFASKEVLVAAGELIMRLVNQYGIKMLPVDSEHSAIAQVLNPQVTSQNTLTYPLEKISKIILTASGGTFRNLTKSALAHKTAADALKHPNWQMGKKITIDSATLMNKGLEIIEAHHLFGLPFNQIEVIIHPQSIIHSLAEFIDGSVLAQLGLPDMRLPIQYAIYFPERRATSWPKLSLAKIKELTFQEPDHKTFPALKLAVAAGQAGGTLPTVLNGANEAAVAFFLANRIKFLEITQLVESALENHRNLATPALTDILAADQWARDFVKERCSISSLKD